MVEFQAPSLKELQEAAAELHKRHKAVSLRYQVARGDGSPPEEAQRHRSEMKAIQADVARINLAIHEIQENESSAARSPAVRELLESLEKSAQQRSEAAVDRERAEEARHVAATHETRAAEAERRTHAIASDLIDNVVSAWQDAGTKASRLAAGAATLVFAATAALLAKSESASIDASLLRGVFIGLGLALLSAVLPTAFHLLLASKLSKTDMHQLHDDENAVRSAEASIRTSQLSLHQTRLWLTIIQFLLVIAALSVAGVALYQFYVEPPST